MSNEETAAAIARQSRKFEAAYAAADSNALVDGYFAADADNPTAYPPGGTAPVSGRAALKALFAGMFVDVPVIRLELVDLLVSDTLATEIGLAHLTTRDGSKVKGRYVVCWIRTGEGWRAKVDFFAEDGWAD